MRVAVMQPYFLPYAGYYQLISSVDIFVVYDNIKYTKKGWINRNRFLQNGTDALFTLPLKNDSDSLDICDRELTDGFEKDKFLRKFEGSYRSAKYFEQTFGLLSRIVQFEEKNLFKFILNSLEETCRYLGISTKIMVSSSIDINHQLQAQDKVLALCTALGAKKYVNAIGGVELYSREKFRDRGIELCFIRPQIRDYLQFSNAYIPSLSIIDMMMFLAIDDVVNCVNFDYEMI